MPNPIPRSLEEVHSSVETRKKGFFRKLFAFIGPAYLVSVGYMDPGNWATDIAGGSRYGYALIWSQLYKRIKCPTFSVLVNFGTGTKTDTETWL